MRTLSDLSNQKLGEVFKSYITSENFRVDELLIILSIDLYISYNLKIKIRTMQICHTRRKLRDDLTILEVQTMPNTFHQGDSNVVCVGMLPVALTNEGL